VSDDYFGLMKMKMTKSNYFDGNGDNRQGSLIQLSILLLNMATRKMATFIRELHGIVDDIKQLNYADEMIITLK